MRAWKHGAVEGSITGFSNSRHMLNIRLPLLEDYKPKGQVCFMLPKIGEQDQRCIGRELRSQASTSVDVVN
jgi:hypothetical protein